MAGIRINDLTEAVGIETTDNVVIARSNDTKKITGKTFIESFSGVKNAANYGGGVEIYKGIVESTTDAFGTTLQFNTLNGSGGIGVNLSSNVINIKLENGGVKNVNIGDLEVDSNKLSTGAVTTTKISNGAVTPDKQSGTLCSVATKTNVETIAAAKPSFITGLSATVTPTSTSSKVLLTGTLSIGAVHAGIILRRTINGTHTNLEVGIDSDKMSQATFFPPRNFGDTNPASFPLNYVDSPNTTSPVTYSIYVLTTGTHAAYINRGFTETNAKTSFRAISQLAAIVLP